MKPIAIFYHCLFALGEPPQQLHSAHVIVTHQMAQLAASGLLGAAALFVVGVNGGEESEPFVKQAIPAKANVMYFGLRNRNENLTIFALENFVKNNPSWNVLYFHAKSASHSQDSEYGKSASLWREGMAQDLIVNWRQCVEDLETHDIVCSHWMWNMADGTQHIPAGNFIWITSNFAAKLPSIFLRERIKEDGIAALSSRYEAEVYWGNGPRPVVKSYRPNGGGGVP